MKKFFKELFQAFLEDVLAEFLKKYLDEPFMEFLEKALVEDSWRSA